MFRVRSLTASDSWTSDAESPNRVTNCDTDDCDEPGAIVLFDDEEIPVEYTCAGAAPVDGNGNGTFVDNDYSISDTSSAETQISVDYEALIPLGVDANANARLLQWRLLLAAVQETGLDRCQFQTPLVGDEPNVRRLNSRSSSSTTTSRTTSRALDALEWPVVLFAIRSDLDASSQLDIPCYNMKPDPVKMCLPMRTVLTLKYQGSAQDTTTVQDHVKSLLEQIMIDQKEKLYVMDVEGLQYVGTFDMDNTLDTSNTNGSELSGVSNTTTSTDVIANSEEGGDAVMRIGTSVSVVSAIVLIVLLLVFRRHPARQKEKQQQSTEKGPTDDDLEKDLECGESGEQPVIPTTCTTLMTSSGSSEYSNSYFISLQGSGSSEDSSDTVQEPALPINYSAEETADNADDENEHMIDLGSLKTHSADSADTRPAVQVPCLETHSLPPRPPRRGSVQLKKRRRKRKKKRKKSTLVRISSREQINAMEAIPESADDGSEIESSEGGSEEWSEDDEDDDISSSTASTPVRSQSLPESLSGSPNRTSNIGNSTAGSSFFPPNAFAHDFSFVMEALDFHFGRQGSHANNDDSNAEGTVP